MHWTWFIIDNEFLSQIFFKKINYSYVILIKTEKKISTLPLVYYRPKINMWAMNTNFFLKDVIYIYGEKLHFKILVFNQRVERIFLPGLCPRKARFWNYTNIASLSIINLCAKFEKTRFFIGNLNWKRKDIFELCPDVLRS